MTLEPFFKWAGGKGRLMRTLYALRPAEINSYYEPFLGGGALFLKMLARQDAAKRKHIVGDSNAALITTWCIVRNEPKELFRVLEAMYAAYSTDWKNHYYHTRAHMPTDPLDLAAWFLYITHFGFNGIFRVNRNGVCNVGLGDFSKRIPWRSSTLHKISFALTSHTICFEHADFGHTCAHAEAGDFVYLDPPYGTVSTNNNNKDNIGYNKDIFDETKFAAMIRTVKKLDQRGVNVMISNSDTELIRDRLGGWNVNALKATSTLASTNAGRVPRAEVIITNYAPASGMNQLTLADF